MSLQQTEFRECIPQLLDDLHVVDGCFVERHNTLAHPGADPKRVRALCELLDDGDRLIHACNVLLTGDAPGTPQSGQNALGFVNDQGIHRGIHPFRPQYSVYRRIEESYG